MERNHNEQRLKSSANEVNGWVEARRSSTGKQYEAVRKRKDRRMHTKIYMTTAKCNPQAA